MGHPGGSKLNMVLKGIGVKLGSSAIGAGSSLKGLEGGGEWSAQNPTRRALIAQALMGERGRERGAIAIGNKRGGEGEGVGREGQWQ